MPSKKTKTAKPDPKVAAEREFDAAVETVKAELKKHGLDGEAVEHEINTAADVLIEGTSDDWRNGALTMFINMVGARNE